MHLIDSQNNQNNRFVGANGLTNTAGTRISADWLNMLQAELAAILATAGITPSKGVNNQVVQAITTLIAQAIAGGAGEDGVVTALGINGNTLSASRSQGLPSLSVDLSTAGFVQTLIQRIAQLEQLTQSDDINLDQIQEIVNFIKQNAHDIANAAPDWAVIKNKPDLPTRVEVVALIESIAVCWEKPNAQN